MSVTQATVTSTQVAVRYRRNVGSLSIDMWTDTQPMCRSRCVGQHSDRHIGRDICRHVDRHIPIDTSAESRSICRPTYQSTCRLTVDRYVGRDVDRHIGRGVCKLHVIRKISDRIKEMKVKYNSNQCWGAKTTRSCGEVNLS